MRIKYRQQHNRRKRFSQIILLTLILLSVSIILMISSKIGTLTKTFYATAVYGVSEITNTLKGVQGTMIPKKTLLKENQELRILLQKMQIISHYNKVLEEENAHLKALFFTPFGNKIYKTNNDPKPILARIIDYKDSIYGTLLAKIEYSDFANSNILPGAIVHFGKLAIGEVTEINNNYVLIKLFTAGDTQHNVIVGGVPANFQGNSNATGKIILPKQVKIKIGDIVSLPKANGLLIGVVEDIKHDTVESTQTLLIKSPIRISELQFISITNN